MNTIWVPVMIAWAAKALTLRYAGLRGYRTRHLLGGQYLEVKMTAEDLKALAKPYTYTRYFKKLDSEVMDDVCQDEE